MENVVYWHWIVFGMVLLILEMLIPGAIFLWFGVAAVVVGGVVFLFPELSWSWQLLIFGGLALACLASWKHFRKNKPNDDTESGTLSQRNLALVGRKTVLKEAIKNGVGKVQIDDTFWRVEGRDLEKGTQVVVESVNGATLIVKPCQHQ